MKETEFKGVFVEKKGKRTSLMTRNLLPGKTHFEERLIRQRGDEFREWDPRRSKLAAAILKGVKEIGIKRGSTVLYLGASHGYTPSFVSDIVGKPGFVFALDFAPRVVKDLVFVCEQRQNMCPIMADANQPQTYKNDVDKANIIYQDIAQRNQAEIFIKNMEAFLRPGGIGLLAVKARSVDISRKPKAIFNEVKDKLSRKLNIIDMKTLDPFEKDHCFFVCKRK